MHGISCTFYFQLVAMACNKPLDYFTCGVGCICGMYIRVMGEFVKWSSMYGVILVFY